ARNGNGCRRSPHSSAAMSFQSAIPQQVALQQCLPLLHRLQTILNNQCCRTMILQRTATTPLTPCLSSRVHSKTEPSPLARFDNDQSQRPRAGAPAPHQTCDMIFFTRYGDTEPAAQNLYGGPASGAECHFPLPGSQRNLYRAVSARASAGRGAISWGAPLKCKSRYQ